MPDPSFNPADGTQRAFYDYLPDRIPSTRDEPVDRYVRSLLDNPDAFREDVAAVSPAGRSVLAAYAERMASLSVRANDPTRLASALVALIAGGLIDADHNAVVAMSLVDRAAVLLGMDSERLATRLPNGVLEVGRLALSSWGARSTELRSINAMGYAEGTDSDGFRFQHAAWMGNSRDIARR